MMHKKHKAAQFKLVLTAILMILSFGSCKKFIDVPSPVTSVTSDNVYNSNVTATAVLTGLYSQLSTYSPSTASISSFSFLGGLSSDEFTLWSGAASGQLLAYYTNNLSATTNFGAEFWTTTYPEIFVCNSAINGLNTSTGLTPAVKQQLLGEAKFMRAYFYFYLVNLYGDVAMPLGTDYKQNQSIAKTPKAQVYLQIIQDLSDAQNLLSANYEDATLLKTTTERTRPTKWAASALLARVYLYYGNLTGQAQYYASAETAATTLLQGNSLFSLSPLTGTNSVFIKNNPEAIWQLQPVNLGVTNTYDAYYFVIPATGPNSYLNRAYLSNNLLNSFEPGDQRYTNWVGSVIAGGTTYYFPYKYKASAINAPVTEYEMMLRLGEQYLIRAEARAQQGNISGAQADLNAIRQRAGLPATTASTAPALLTAILHERQIEFFTEMGHRWLDLKRTGNVDAVMSVITPLKGGVWKSYQQFYPVPLTDITDDPNLTQTPGY